MTEHKIALYDAFSDKTFNGNVAAIVADAGALTTQQMQKTAQEFNAPTTCCITALQETDIHVRFFSTHSEYPMCGHATVALLTWLIDQHIYHCTADEPLKLRLNTPATSSNISVTRRADDRLLVMFTLDAAIFEATRVDKKQVAESTGITLDDLDNKLPVELTRSDFTHLVVPLNNLSAMYKLTANYDALLQLSRQYAIDTVAFITLDTKLRESTMHCRDFCPAVGALESPATGTTNRALACYLHRHHLINAPYNGECRIITEQGYVMGRPGQIFSVLQIKNGKVRWVEVGGVASKTMEGLLFTD